MNRSTLGRLTVTGMVILLLAACTSTTDNSATESASATSGSTPTSSSATGSSAAVSAGGTDSSTAAPSGTTDDTEGGVVTMQMAAVGNPGNPSVGVVQTFGGPKGQFADPPKNSGIYPTCAAAPAAPPDCLTVGSVGYEFGIGEFEVTVSQYVTFLNTVDRDGKNLHDLYYDNMNPTVWPQYGSVDYSANARHGEHYAVAYPEWADKPFNFGDFSRGARFANSLTNGKVLSTKKATTGGFTYTSYEVRLSEKSEQGMYDMTTEAPTRTATSGFVIPSNDEWIKAAYYDPKGGGTNSYWSYPTGPTDPPNVTVLDPATGDVTNPEDQPLATYNPNDPNSPIDTPGGPAGVAPTWCPPQTGSACGQVFPADLPAGLDLPSLYMANVSTVGQAKTPSPWGTFDQGGNVVEILDTLVTNPPAGYNFLRDWHYYHGGVANAPAYQVEISAFGPAPGDWAFTRFYPWLGFRIGLVGTPS